MGPVSSNMLVARLLQEPERSRGDVKVGDVVLVDDIPIPRRIRIHRAAFKDNR